MLPWFDASAANDSSSVNVAPPKSLVSETKRQQVLVEALQAVESGPDGANVRRALKFVSQCHPSPSDNSPFQLADKVRNRDSK